jgi:hypothetical protein
MDDMSEPMFMFPPDILVGRMEQVRKLVETMQSHAFAAEELTSLRQAVTLLLDSCSTPDPKDTQLPDNVTTLKH